MLSIGQSTSSKVSSFLTAQQHVGGCFELYRFIFTKVANEIRKKAGVKILAIHLAAIILG